MAAQYQIVGDDGRRRSRPASRPGSARARSPPGAPLPPVRALAAELGVSPGHRRRGLPGAARSAALVETAGRHGTRVRPATAGGAGRAGAAPARPARRPRPVRRRARPAAAARRSAPHLAALAATADPPAGYGDGGRAARAGRGGPRAAAPPTGCPCRAVTVTGGASTASSGCSSPTCAPATRSRSRTPAGPTCSTWSPRSGCGRCRCRSTRRAPSPAAAGRHSPPGVARPWSSPPGAEPDRRGGHRRPGRRTARGARPRTRVLLIEDDHAAELSRRSRCTRSPGRHGAWAFVRSVSKPYGPDLRLAVARRRRDDRRPGRGADAARLRLGLHRAATAGARAVAGPGGRRHGRPRRGQLRASGGRRCAPRSADRGVVAPRAQRHQRLGAGARTRPARSRRCATPGTPSRPARSSGSRSPPGIRITVEPARRARHRGAGRRRGPGRRARRASHPQRVTSEV